MLEAIHRANQVPICQAATAFLKMTDVGANPTHLAVTSLAMWGLENGLRVPAMAQPGYWLVRVEEALGPEQVVEMVGPLDLSEETDPLDAAAMVLEEIVNAWEGMAGVSLR